jgi:hypothetical protein
MRKDVEQRLIRQALALKEIEDEETLAAKAMGFYPQIMCQIALPRDQFKGNEYVRHSGPFHLSIQTPSMLGVPYGIYPRGILAWIAAEVQRKKNSPDASRTLTLGSSMFEFMQKISGAKSYSGGKKGNIAPFKRSLFSLLGSRILYWTNDKVPSGEVMNFQSVEIATSGAVLWPTRFSTPTDTLLVPSTITLGEVFYNDLLKHSVPIDLRAIASLWPACLPVDIYVWLTYKAFILKKEGRSILRITWIGLKLQFGPDVGLMKNFRTNFLQALRQVQKAYPAVEFTEVGKSVEFRLTRPSVLSKPREFRLEA